MDTDDNNDDDRALLDDCVMLAGAGWQRKKTSKALLLVLCSLTTIARSMFPLEPVFKSPSIPAPLSSLPLSTLRVLRDRHSVFLSLHLSDRVPTYRMCVEFTLCRRISEKTVIREQFRTEEEGI